MQEALKLAPDDVGINNDLGYTWADAGRNLDEAEKMLRYAVGESPREAAYLDSLGWVYYKKGDFANALRWLTRAAAESDGHDPVIYDHLGDTLWRLRQPDAARKRWQQAVDTARERAEKGLGDQDAEIIEKTREKLAALSRNAKPSPASTTGEPQPASRRVGEPTSRQ
jgi:Flp pilus assembly protein TadD